MKQLLFAANDGSLGFEYYLTDGVTVTLLGDLNPGPNDSYQFNDDFAQIGASFVFAATNGQAGNELFGSTGTSAGTSLVKDINFGPGSSSPIILETAGDKTFFAAITAAEGDELWATDGTAAGTVLVRDIRPGGDSSGPDDFEDFKGSLLFTANDGVNGRELYISNGTALGTRVLKDINPGAASSNPGGIMDDGSNVLGSRFFFSAESGAIGRELWSTDGTEAGTVLVKDILTTRPDVPDNTGTTVSIPLGTAVLSTLESPTDTADVFRVDLNAGTTYVFGLSGVPGGNGTLPDPLLRLLNPNGTQAAINDDISGAANRDSQITFTATTTGTHFLSAQSFAGATNTTGTYRLTAVVQGNGIIDTLDLNSPGSNPANFKAFGQFMFFTASDGVNGTELWASDGTNGGTQLVKDINPNGSSNPIGLTVLNDKLLFAANNGTTGSELWVSNGTPQGTTLLRDINGGGNSSNPFDFVQVGNRLVFAATDGSTGRELYFTDGTVGGTGLLVDIEAGTGNSSPSDFTLVGDKVFFSAFTTANGVELWMTDGTTAGTMRVTDIDPGADSSSPDLIGVVDFAAANTAPVNLALSANVIAENSANGTVVGSLSATDADGDPLTFSLTDSGGGRFSINGSNVVVAGALDFETQASIPITAQASDGKGGVVTNTFTVQVSDVNEGGSGGTQNGTGGNDTFQNTSGPDSAFGLGGTDVFIYNAPRAALEDNLLPDGRVQITDPFTNTVDTLTDVEIVRMNDGDYRFDLLDGITTNVTPNSPQQNLEFVYRLYAASLGRTPGADGLKGWFERLMDGRQNRDSLADAFVLSAEFQNKFAGLNGAEAIVTQYFREILDREPAPTGLNFWVNKFNTGSDLSDLLTSFAVSPEFVNNNADNYDDGVFVTRGGPVQGIAGVSDEGFGDFLDLG